MPVDAAATSISATSQKNSLRPARRLALSVVNVIQAVYAYAQALVSFAGNTAHALRPARIVRPVRQKRLGQMRVLRRSKVLFVLGRRRFGE